MVKIIIDTNIIFSALVNSKGSIGDIIFNSEEIFEFYSCNYMRMEIEKHEKKLIKISKLSEIQLEESKDMLFSKINFINEELIPQKVWVKAENILIDIDADDIDFLALTMHLKGRLWTGDLKLFNGLRKNKYKSVYTTSELIRLKNRM